MLDVNNRNFTLIQGNNILYTGMANEVVIYRVAIYLRLSRDDENVGDSESIINQREFLTKYVEKQNNWILVDIYVDDGYKIEERHWKWKNKFSNN